jgi:hypothetical protein
MSHKRRIDGRGLKLRTKFALFFPIVFVSRGEAAALVGIQLNRNKTLTRIQPRGDRVPDSAGTISNAGLNSSPIQSRFQLHASNR